MQQIRTTLEPTKPQKLCSSEKWLNDVWNSYSPWFLGCSRLFGSCSKKLRSSFGFCAVLRVIVSSKSNPLIAPSALTEWVLTVCSISALAHWSHGQRNFAWIILEPSIYPIVLQILNTFKNTAKLFPFHLQSGICTRDPQLHWLSAPAKGACQYKDFLVMMMSIHHSCLPWKRVWQNSFWALAWYIDVYSDLCSDESQTVLYNNCL